MVPVGLLFVAQIAVITSLGTRMPGPAFGNLVDLAFNLFCACVFWQAARRSTSLSRYFWLVATFSVSVFCVSLLLNFYVVVIRPSRSVAEMADMLSIFWFGPVSLTLFLEPDFEPARFDRVHILDFIQVILFGVAIYFFFLYLPTHEASASVFAHTWLRSNWAGSLVYDGAMAVVFLLRSVLTNSPVVRALFGRTGLFLVCVCLGDFYYNYFGADLPNGSWYEVIWTLLNIVPIVIAATWSETAVRNTAAKSGATGLIGNRMFTILFAFLVLALSMVIVREHTLFALIMVTLSFACSSWRLIIIQQRQERIGIALHAEIVERKRVEQRLREHEEHLEEQVAERTARLEESNTRLRQAQLMSAVGMLVGGVAHEVRNPLFGISANLDALELHAGARAEYAPTVGRIRGEVERLSALMQDLLEYGKPARPVAAPGLLEVVVAEAVECSASLAAANGVRLVNNVGSGLPPVLMDPGRLARAVHNLLQNSVQHSPAGSAVTIEAASEAAGDRRWVVLTITDSGPGFDPEDLPHIFEPFFSRRRGGTGLGLAIVQRIVEEQGGTIAAVNRPGGGAATTLRLPCVPPRAAA